MGNLWPEARQVLIIARPRPDARRRGAAGGRRAGSRVVAAVAAG